MAERLRGLPALVAVLVFCIVPLSCSRSEEASGEAAATTAASVPDTISVQIVGVNDFEGKLEPTEEDGRRVGGAAYLAAYLETYAERDPGGTIKVHVGDMVGASPLISSYFHDEPTIEATNLMGFDVGTLGNHEFDEGGEEMLRLINGGWRTEDGRSEGGQNTSDPNFGGADYPYVSANVVYALSGETVLPPYEIVERKGVEIGIIGATTEAAPAALVPDAAAPFEFLDISDSVDRYAGELQGKGVETIVVLAHSGNENEEVDPPRGEIVREAEQMSGAVDAIIGGNTEYPIDEEIAGKLVVQGSGKGADFTVTSLEVSHETGDVVDSSGEIVDVVADEVRPDPELQALVEESQERIAPIAGREIGVAAEYVSADPNRAGESALGDLIADAQREFTGADFAFTNHSGIRADLAAGPVTYGDLFAAQPFDNRLVVMQMTGEQVGAILEQQLKLEVVPTILQVSGLRYAYDEGTQGGGRIVEITLPNGDPLDPAATYTVAVNSFLATGGDGFTRFAEGQNARSVGGDLEALVWYVENLPQPFSAPDPAQEQRINERG